LNALLADVESSTSLAALHLQSITIANMTCRLIPEFQRNAVAISDSSIVIEGLAASRISARKNQLIFRHLDRTFRSITRYRTTGSSLV
jgi:hypothetical protein